MEVLGLSAELVEVSKGNRYRAQLPMARSLLRQSRKESG